LTRRCAPNFNLIQIKMMNIVFVLCSDNYCVAIDLDTLKDCPPVLSRFLGMNCDGVAPPETDELGRLTFVTTFGITRDRFLDCLAFVRCGRINDIHKLIDTFNVLGGCDMLDECYLKVLKDSQEQQVRFREEQEQKKLNPLCPAENVLQLFKFEAHQSLWTHDNDEWEAVGVVEEVPHNFWWRKRISRE